MKNIKKILLFMLISISILATPDAGFNFSEEILFADDYHIFTILSVSDNNGNHYSDTESVYLITYNNTGEMQSKQLIRDGKNGYDETANYCCFRTSKKVNKKMLNDKITETFYVPDNRHLPHISLLTNELYKDFYYFYDFDKEGFNFYQTYSDEIKKEQLFSFDLFEKKMKQLSLNYEMFYKGKEYYTDSVLNHWKIKRLNRIIDLNDTIGYEISIEDGSGYQGQIILFLEITDDEDIE